MSTVSEQLAALTQIRNLIEKHFPLSYYYDSVNMLQNYIDIEPHQEIEWDKDRLTYVLHTPPVCKVCSETGNLIEVPTVNGHFHICRDCKNKIVSSGTLAANDRFLVKAS